MGDPNAWGGITQGLAQGFMQGQALQQQRQEMQLRKEYYDILRKEAKIKVDKAEAEARARQTLQTEFFDPMMKRQAIEQQLVSSPEVQATGQVAPGLAEAMPPEPGLPDLLVRARWAEAGYPEGLYPKEKEPKTLAEAYLGGQLPEAKYKELTKLEKGPTKIEEFKAIRDMSPSEREQFFEIQRHLKESTTINLPGNAQFVGADKVTGKPVVFNPKSKTFEVVEDAPSITGKEGAGQDFRQIMDLRKEFNALPEIKQYKEISTKHNIMQKAFEQSKKTKNFVAVDQALITLFNKMTDPESVVRESEYIRTPEDMAIWNRLQATASRWQKGGKLEPETRQALMTMAGKFIEAYQSTYNSRAMEYQQLAERQGLKPEDVILSPSQKKAKTIVERRKTADGKILVKYSDGTIGEE